LPRDLEQLKRIHEDALLSEFVYGRDPESLPPGWSTSTALADQLAGTLKLETDRLAAMERPEGTLHASSGLTACVLVNDELKQVVLAFGGTTSGATASIDVLARIRPNVTNLGMQCMANVTAGLGWAPQSYLQADALAKALAEQLAPTGYGLRLVGHSKGGGEASFAALMSKPPLPANVFNPAHLSAGLVAMLPRHDETEVHDTVHAYSVEGDLVPGLRNLVSTVVGAGTEHFVPADVTVGQDLLTLHGEFPRHIMNQCEEAEVASLLVTPPEHSHEPRHQGTGLQRS
jgi:hypothetical protein